MSSYVEISYTNTGPYPATPAVGRIMSQSVNFEDFYRQYYGKLTGSLKLVCGDFGVAEELAQEAFIKAYDRWERIESSEDPAGWLFKTAFNLSKKRWRSAAFRRSSIGIDDALIGSATEPNSDRTELLAALGRLPLKQRGAVVTRYVLGYSSEEAAQILGMSPGALRTTLHRATNALRLDPSFLSTRP